MTMCMLGRVNGEGKKKKKKHKIIEFASEMELRDHFAGLAIQAILSYTGGFVKDKEINLMTTDAYKIADGMMKARNNHG